MIFRKSNKNKSQAETALPLASSDEENSQPAEPNESSGYLRRLKDRLSKTRKTFSDGFDKIFAGKKRIYDDLLEEIE